MLPKYVEKVNKHCCFKVWSLQKLPKQQAPISLQELSLQLLPTLLGIPKHNDFY